MTGASCLMDEAGLASLAAEWQALWAAVPDACPFLSPAWMLPWWRVWGTGAPRVSVLRGEAGRLDGVLPLYLLEGRLLNMGAGVSDRFDALLRPGCGADGAARLLAAALSGVTMPCELTELPPGAALLGAAAPAGWAARQTVASACPVLDLAGGFEAVPPLARRKWRMASHRANRLGGWTFDIAGPDEVDQAWAVLRGLHGARWRADRQDGVLADAQVQRFHHLALRGLQQAGALRLATLHIGGRPAAAAHTLLAGSRRILFYIGGWDPAFADASPGTLLIGAMLQQAVAEGRREADFLRGTEAYKYRWGAVDRANHCRRLDPT